MLRKLALILSVGAMGSLAQADDLFQLSWRGTAYTTSESGQIVARSVTERDFIKKAADDNGLDPRSLVFVYRADKHDTAVVRAADGAFIADVIQMEYVFTEVSNASQTSKVRQAFLFDEYHDSAIGSAFGTERIQRDADGNIVRCTFRGTFQYSYPDKNTVVNGSFSTGRRIADRSGN